MDLAEIKARGNDKMVRHPWELARLVALKKLISEQVNLKNQSTVLDIGCGDTFVVEQLAIDYPNVSFYAIDIAFTDEMIKQFSEKLRVKNVFLFSSVDDFISKTDHVAALIILTDVIEHIADDKKFISQLLQNKFISDNTLFLITVPAFQSLFCSHDIFLGHYRRYTNKSLRSNLSFAGLSIVRMGYFFTSLIPLRLFQVVKEKIFRYDKKNISTGLATWNGGSAKSNLFKNILLADISFSFLLNQMSINIPGLSNYAICKRSA